MFHYNRLLILCLAHCHLSSCQESVESSFRSAGIVSDVVDRAPSDFLEVNFGNATVSLGNELTPTQVINAPTVSWPVYNHTAIYTLIMIDPDVPSRGNRSMGESKVWLVGNIQRNNVATGETIVEYISPAPSNGSWHHRYVFLAYLQPNRIDYSLEPIISNRWGLIYVKSIETLNFIVFQKHRRSFQLPDQELHHAVQFGRSSVRQFLPGRV